jgi:hypothetical protein
MPAAHSKGYRIFIISFCQPVRDPEVPHENPSSGFCYEHACSDIDRRLRISVIG